MSSRRFLHHWSLPEVKEYVGLAWRLRDKAMIAMIFQSGLEIQNLLPLNYGTIQKQIEANISPITISLQSYRKKQYAFTTCIGADAVFWLKAYLSTRWNLTADSPLYARARDPYSQKRATVDAVQYTFAVLSRQLIDDLNYPSTHSYAMLSLRTSFRRILTGHMNRWLIHHMMGLIPRISGFKPPTSRSLRREYRKCEHYLAFGLPRNMFFRRY